MKRIVVIGPESTGKSTLCQQLAAHFDTVWCPEYAREYLLKNGTAYTADDLDKIARGQLALQAQTEAGARNGRCFVDTDLYVMKVWYEVAFATCPTWILKALAQRAPDLYLLCNTDLPWAPDELREYPDLAVRQRLFKMYFDIVLNCPVPWVVVAGTDQQRLQTAINAVEGLYSKQTTA